MCGEIERFHVESNARETSLKAGRLGKSEVKELKRGERKTSKEADLSPLARLKGVEPPTYGSEVRRSIQLSYRRTLRLFLL